jgi:conjugal transfer mating pair stabilization protein TraG
MFITQYSAAQLSALAPNGMTMATMAGIDSVNQNMETLAGYLLMFVPVMAAGMAKGAMSIASNTTAMLAPAMHAAEAAAVERTTGNYAYGNSQFQNVTGHQVNTAPTWNVASPIPQVNMRGDNGTITSTMADGSTVYNTSGAISRFGFSASEMQSVTGNLQQTARNITRAPMPSAKPRPSAGAMGCAPSTACRPARAARAGAKGQQAVRAEHHHIRSAGDRFKQHTGSNRTIGENLTSGRSLGHAETNTFGINAGAKAGVGGKVLGAEVGASAGGTWDHRWLRPPAIRRPMAPATTSAKARAATSPAIMLTDRTSRSPMAAIGVMVLSTVSRTSPKNATPSSATFPRRNRSNVRLPAPTRSARASNAWPRSRAATGIRSPTT